MTLAFEDANSKVLDVVIVADVDAEERVDDGLVAILKLGLVEILNLIFGQDIFCQDFEDEIWSRF